MKTNNPTGFQNVDSTIQSSLSRIELVIESELQQVQIKRTKVGFIYILNSLNSSSFTLMNLLVVQFAIRMEALMTTPQYAPQLRILHLGNVASFFSADTPGQIGVILSCIFYCISTSQYRKCQALYTITDFQFLEQSLCKNINCKTQVFQTIIQYYKKNSSKASKPKVYFHLFSYNNKLF